VQQTVGNIRALLADSSPRDSVRIVLVTAAAGRLPGLVPALQAFIGEQPVPATPDSGEDFGEDLLESDNGTPRLAVLAQDAAAWAAHHLAGRFQRGELPRGHLDHFVSLSTSGAAAVGAPHARTLRILSPDSE
jgi:hypothetical protein